MIFVPILNQLSSIWEHKDNKENQNHLICSKRCCSSSFKDRKTIQARSLCRKHHILNRKRNPEHLPGSDKQIQLSGI